METTSSGQLFQRLRKQGYHLVGKHSAVKACKWAGCALRREGKCYKHAFYGIESHRCVQCTPALQFCTLSCRFCWRMMPEISKRVPYEPALICGTDAQAPMKPPDGLGRLEISPEEKWQKLPTDFEWDDAGTIIDGLLMGQKKLVSGFGAFADKKMFGEALAPRHAAISLTGEPTIYPHLGELICEFHKREMTTFLVTNGTLPQQIRKLEAEKRLPTQLYVSMVAPDEKTYLQTAQTEDKRLWKNYLETLEILKGIGKCHRTALRMTLVKRLNAGTRNTQPETLTCWSERSETALMAGAPTPEPQDNSMKARVAPTCHRNCIDGYAKQIELAKPWYVEVKSFVYVGGARKEERGLCLNDMLMMEEVREFAKLLAEKTGYIIAAEHAPSRVVLLCRNENAAEGRIIKHA
ncbi:hypothetical protein AUJ13_01680 [Candidatus Micrarchaeota archaeon CG1_02_49_24]|nr:MAG: hypothetical protein AUJ13_01680 [Candidatus Micrarchaeota archaeon CG1_02_49_24]HII54056.1 radical SAM protein [Candidatus Micrarchaeota archaeon]